MTIRCLIVDDEPLAREGLSQYVEEIDFLELAGTAADPLAAIPLLDQHQPELLFLDIEMPKLNGIDFIKTLKQPPLIVLTTAYPNYALDGFALEVLDYLLKPISLDRFLQSALRARRRLETNTVAVPNDSAVVVEKDPYFFIKADGKIERILRDDVLYVEAMQNYIQIYTSKRRYTTLLSLTELEAAISHPDVMRVHKSFLANLRKVTTLDAHVLVIGEYRIPVARRRWRTVEARFLSGGDLLG